VLASTAREKSSRRDAARSAALRRERPNRRRDSAPRSGNFGRAGLAGGFPQKFFGVKSSGTRTPAGHRATLAAACAGVRGCAIEIGSYVENACATGTFAFRGNRRVRLARARAAARVADRKRGMRRTPGCRRLAVIHDSLSGVAVFLIVL